MHPAYRNRVSRAAHLGGDSPHGLPLSRLSQPHLPAGDRQETGISFHHYLNNVRVTKAKELIRTTNLRLTDISQMVGYDDQSYFTKVFKRTTGVTPGEYSKKNRRPRGE